MSGHPARLGQSAPQDDLHLGVEAAEVVTRPAHQRIVHSRVEPQEDLATGGHV